MTVRRSAAVLEYITRPVRIRGMPRALFVAMLAVSLVWAAPARALADRPLDLRLLSFDDRDPAAALLRVDRQPHHSWRFCAGLLLVVLAAGGFAGAGGAVLQASDPAAQNPKEMRTAAALLGSSALVLLVSGLLLLGTEPAPER